MVNTFNKIQIKTTFLLLMLACTNFIIAQESPKKYPSLLWEISGNGSSKPSYLYGTMHVSSKLAFHLGDSFFLALKACDMVALESDPTTWLTEMFDSTYLEENGGLYRASTRFKDFYIDAFETKEIDKRVLASSLNISSRMMNGMLYRNSAYNADFEEETYLDMYIFQAGKKFKKPVIGLEGFLESDKLVRQSQIPDDDEDDQPVNKDYRKMMRSGKSPSEMLQEAYRNEDLDMVDSIQKIMNPSKNHQKYMLHIRNENMAHRMDSIFKSKKTLFTGIGAAHLAGEKGVIEMLRAMGYTVRPVTRIIAETSKKYRDSLEKLYVNKPLQPFKTADGWISVNLPEPFFEIPANGFYKMYFYPEMANGTNYSLVRLKHSALLLNQTPAYIVKRIDSLLYENIPGKILDQKPAVHDGYPGFDILNRTKKGDYERYRILVTPVEVVIFKVGGTLEYLKDNKNLDDVFNSFHVVPNPEKWASYSSKYGFSFNLPGRPITDEANDALDKLMGSDVNISGYDKNNNFYSLRRVGLQDFNYIEEDTFELSYLATEFNKALQLTEVSRGWDSLLHFPSIRVTAKDTTGYLHSVYAIDGPRYYQMLARTQDSIWPAAYFQSFQKHDVKLSKPLKQFEDTACFYTVETTTKPAGWSNFNFYEIIRNKKNKEDNGLNGRYNTRIFTDVVADEEINLNFRQYHKYYYCPSYDSLWRSEKNEYKEMGLFVKKEKVSADSSIFDLELTDTNSNRKIIIRHIVHNGTIYTMSTLGTDNDAPFSPFVEHFWTSFKPDSDTIIGLPFNQNKANIFMDDLLHGDSLTQIHAIKSFYQITFENKHVPQLIELVESFKHKEFTLDNRINIIETLGELKHKNILPYFKDVYNRSLDTPQLQIAVLQALVYHKSNAGTKLFKALLDSETPLVNSYLVAQLFSPMYDSMEMYKELFPFLLRFTPYPEYKNNVYNLMAAMLDSGVLKPSKYKKYKKELVRESKDALKRIMAGSHNAYDSYNDYDDYDYYHDYDDYSSGNEDYGSGSSTLGAYHKLLIPFKSDKDVKAYFERTRRLNSPDELFNTSMLFLKEGIYVNDTIWTHFANRDDYRLQLHKELAKLNKLTLMPDSTKTQTMMARALLYKGYSTDKKDSIQLIKKVEVINKKGIGFLYVFKKKDSYKEKEWNFDYIGILPADSTKVVYKSDVTNKNNDYIDEEEMDKKLDEVVKGLFYSDRKRVKKSSRGYDIDYYDY